MEETYEFKGKRYSWVKGAWLGPDRLSVSDMLAAQLSANEFGKSAVSAPSNTGRAIHYIAYHSTESEGHEFKPGAVKGDVVWHTRKKAGILRSALGASTWVIVGTKLASGMRYQLVCRFTPNASGPSPRREEWSTISGPMEKKWRVTLNELPWFKELLRQKFASKGFQPVYHPEVIAGLRAALE